MINVVRCGSTELVVTFTQKNEVTFHDILLGKELVSFGIEILPLKARKLYENQAFVFPSKGEDHRALKLFKQAFIEIYMPRNSLHIQDLK